MIINLSSPLLLNFYKLLGDKSPSRSLCLHPRSLLVFDGFGFISLIPLSFLSSDIQKYRSLYHDYYHGIEEVRKLFPFSLSPFPFLSLHFLPFPSLSLPFYSSFFLTENGRRNLPQCPLSRQVGSGKGTRGHLYHQEKTSSFSHS